MNVFLLQLLRSADAFPGAGNLDQNALPRDATIIVHGNKPSSLEQRALGIEAQDSIDFGGDAAGNELENFTTEINHQPVHAGLTAGWPVTARFQGILNGVLQ